MKNFGLVSPTSVEEASALLKEHGDAAVVCAGGTELIPLLKLGLADPALLVRLGRLGIDRTAEDDGFVCFGAGVTHLRASASELVKGQLPLVSDVLNVIANPRVRATGTLGGSLCFAEPHSDVSTLLLLHDARVVLSTGVSDRRVPVGAFVTGTLTTSRHDDEIVVAIEVPRPNPTARAGYARFVIGERPNVAVGCTLDVDPTSGALSGARVVVGCAGPAPVRAAKAEHVLDGATLDGHDIDEAVSEAAASCAAECEAYDEDDIGAWYKRKLVGAMARRAVWRALDRAVPGTYPIGEGA